MTSYDSNVDAAPVFRLHLDSEAREAAKDGERPEAPTGPDERKAGAQMYRELAEHEARGAKHLREAAKLSATSHAGVLSALLEAIASDSKKHERILRFIQKRTRSA